MRVLLTLALAVLTLAVPSPAIAQNPNAADRERAVVQNRLGWDYMKTETFDKAAAAFQAAIDIDPTFEVPYYGLGRADMALKKYLSAIAAYVKCRDLYESRAGQRFANAQDAQRYRQDRLTEIDEQIRQVNAMPPSIQQQDMLRQVSNQRRDVQDAITRGNDMSLDATVPPWVSLALGSAYFRSGKLADAEREYKATIAADAKSGEAHNNLAVVYLETGRFAEAEASVKAAKKAGFKVHPQLEQDIRNRKK
ncbi:MAG: tetratricopeptide repeat protein [Vicinamibacterales bacterium]